MLTNPPIKIAVAPTTTFVTPKGVWAELILLINVPVINYNKPAQITITKNPVIIAIIG